MSIYFHISPKKSGVIIAAHVRYFFLIILFITPSVFSQCLGAVHLRASWVLGCVHILMQVDDVGVFPFKGEVVVGACVGASMLSGGWSGWREGRGFGGVGPFG